jgi:hypothetical protein
LVGEFQHEIVGEVLLPGYNKNLIYW